MPLVQPKPLPPQPHVPLVTIDLGSGMVGVPRQWAEWFQSADTTLRLLAAANFVSLVNAANDAAAAAAGVQIGGLYRNVNAVQIRLV